MRAWMSIAAASVVAGLAGAVALAQMKPGSAGIETHAIEVGAEPIASFRKDGASWAASPRLEWRGGLVLASPSPNFGGWSGLLMDADGKGFLAVSDSGVWMTGELSYDGPRPKAIAAARIGQLRDPDTKPLVGERDRDAEAVTLAGGTLAQGQVYISFERNSRIGLFDIGRDGVSPMASMLAMPEEVRNVGNEGLEAMIRLPAGPDAGALVAIAEHPLSGETTHRGWIWIAGEPRSFTIEGVGDYGITDAVTMPDGGVLLLERRYRPADGVRIRLRDLDAKAVAPGATIKGEILLEADDATAEVDNLEALAITTGPAGESVLTIMSDDNFNRSRQRTLLLQFTLGARPDKAIASDAKP